MIKIACWNIRYSLGNDGLKNIQRIGETLKKINADIYVIQEVDINTERGGNTNQFEELQRILGVKGFFTKFFNVSGGEQGLAVFSNLKMLTKESFRIAEIKGNSWVQYVKFQYNNSIFDVVNLHAPWQHTKAYWKNFNTKFNFKDCILCGDFNLELHDERLNHIKENYDYLNKSKPTLYKGKIIDHIFVPKNLKLLSQEVIESNYSDHYILITNVDLW